MRQQPINYYDILGVAQNATTEEIRSAYRARIAQYHPDRNRSIHANALAALVNEAWEVLGGNPERRRQYNAMMGFSERSRFREIHQEEDYKSEDVDEDRRKFQQEWREAHQESKNSQNTSNTAPPAGTPRPLPNAAVQQSTFPAATWSVRVLGLLLAGATVVFMWLGDQPGDYPNKSWFVLLFYVCLLSAIYCFRQSGPSIRWLRWLVIPITLLAGPVGWGLLIGYKTRSEGHQLRDELGLSPGFFRWLGRWLAIGVSLFFPAMTLFVFWGDDHEVEAVGAVLAVVAVCWVIGFSGLRMAHAISRWRHVAEVRRTLLWLGSLVIAATVALLIGPLWSLVVLVACGVLLLLRRERLL